MGDSRRQQLRGVCGVERRLAAAAPAAVRWHGAGSHAHARACMPCMHACSVCMGARMHAMHAVYTWVPERLLSPCQNMQRMGATPVAAGLVASAADGFARDCVCCMGGRQASCPPLWACLQPARPWDVCWLCGHAYASPPLPHTMLTTCHRVCVCAHIHAFRLAVTHTRTHRGTTAITWGRRPLVRVLSSHPHAQSFSPPHTQFLNLPLPHTPLLLLCICCCSCDTGFNPLPTHTLTHTPFVPPSHTHSL
eukprot:366115-Chlamydomonas_euryale.AAC.13